jgi:hypothetical protein
MPLHSSGTGRLVLRWIVTGSRGLGSIRQRRDGVWEVRVSLGPDLISGRSEVKSLTVVGSRDTAQDARRRYAAEAARVRAHRLARAEITLADLLQVWLDADHGWKPSTTTGYRSIVKHLAADPLGRRRAQTDTDTRPPTVARPTRLLCRSSPGVIGEKRAPLWRWVQGASRTPPTHRPRPASAGGAVKRVQMRREDGSVGSAPHLPAAPLPTPLQTSPAGVPQPSESDFRSIGPCRAGRWLTVRRSLSRTLGS